MLFPAIPLARSWRAPYSCLAVPAVSQSQWIDLRGCIERCGSLSVDFELFAAVYRRQAVRDVPPPGCRNASHIIQHELIRDPHGHALLSAVDCPNEGVIRGIELLEPRL